MRHLMRALASTAVVAACLSGAALADKNQRTHDQRRDTVQSWCKDYPRSADCRDFGVYGNIWNDEDFRGFYERNYGPRNVYNQDAALAALFGVVLGVPPGQTTYGTYDRGEGYGSQTRYNAQEAHAAACSAAHDTYRAADDTYVGPDGRSYYCRL